MSTQWNNVDRTRNQKFITFWKQIGKSYVDKKATRKLNQTKADFNKKLKFDEIEIELQFNQAYVDDTDIFVNIVDSNSEIFTTITTKQAKKLIKHLQKMVDYCEE